MRDNAIKYINPFDNPFRPRKNEMAKTRNIAYNNPFLMGPNNFEKLALNNTIIQRPMHYPKVEKDEYDSSKSKAYFQKGKINYNRVLKSYKEIKKSLEKEKEKNDKYL